MIKQTSNFEKRLAFLKKNKAKVYAQMKAEANDPETIAYYEKIANSDLPIE